jgi:hypothetical protein
MESNMKYILLFIILFFTSISISCLAEDDFDVLILDEINDTILIPVGKSSIDLRVSIGNIKCNEYSIEYNSPLFRFSYPIMENGTINSNSTHDYQIDINENSMPGYYNITFKAIVTMEGNPTSTLFFNKSLLYVLSLEILEVIYPSKYERTVQITIQTYLAFNEIIFIFNTDGDVGIDPEVITYTNLSQGLYKFNGTVYQMDIGYGNQEIGFKIMAYYDSQFFEIIEDNANVQIIWEEQDKDEQEMVDFKVLISLFILLLFVNLFWVYLWKRGKNYR